MWMLSETWVPIGSLLEMGGGVVYAILLVTALMWTLIIERLWYLLRVFPKVVSAATPEWRQAQEAVARSGLEEARRNWQAMHVRRSMLSRLGQQARRNLHLIQILMQVLPLLGLLGTVWGMVGVFDIMTLFGTGNARMMASGVSRATIPTMCGLVAALSGLYFVYWLRQRAGLAAQQLESSLRMDIEPSQRQSEQGK